MVRLDDRMLEDMMHIADRKSMIPMLRGCRLKVEAIKEPAVTAALARYIDCVLNLWTRYLMTILPIVKAIDLTMKMKE